MGVWSRCGIDSRFCLSLGGSTSRARELTRDLPSWVHWIELRLDRLSPEDLAQDAWLALPQTCGREWLATWRSPEEGGTGGVRPANLYTRALAAGFRCVDVEADALEGDAELRQVPAERRWISAHLREVPSDLDALRRTWMHVTVHPGVVHKLVLPPAGFEANNLVLELLRSLEPRDTLRSIFVQGWPGHPTRILDYWSHQSVTFVAPEERIATAEGQPSLDRIGRVYGLPRLEAPNRIYGVLGNPIRHSRSPELHNHVFRTLGKRALYLVLESPEAGPVVDWVRRGRLSGLSVTAPFKESVVPLVDDLEEIAGRIGAVNTIWREAGRLRGANTDFEAARDMLSEIGLPSGDGVAVLGAGGSARAVAAGAIENGIPVTFFNRDPERGRRAAEASAAAWGGDPEDCVPETFGAVVNTTPLGSAEAIPASILECAWGRATIIDLVYGPEPTAWERLARERGVPFRGGLEFLARQAAGALERWIGVRPPPALLAEGLAH